MAESPRFLKAAGHEEDGSGKLKKSEHFDKKAHSVSFWDGFYRLVDSKVRTPLLSSTLRRSLGRAIHSLGKGGRRLRLNDSGIIFAGKLKQMGGKSGLAWPRRMSA
jgi:hypothetical protein